MNSEIDMEVDYPNVFQQSAIGFLDFKTRVFGKSVLNSVTERNLKREQSFFSLCKGINKHLSLKIFCVNYISK